MNFPCTHVVQVVFTKIPFDFSSYRQENFILTTWDVFKRTDLKSKAQYSIAMTKKMDFNLLLKILFVLYLVNLSTEKNQTEQRNGKLFREYFLLQKHHI